MIWQAALFHSKQLEEILFSSWRDNRRDPGPFGMAPLLVVRLVPAGSRPTWHMLTSSPDVVIAVDFGIAASEAELMEKIQGELGGHAEEVFACCIITEDSDTQSIEAARACAHRVEAFGVKKIFGSLFIGSAAFPDDTPIQPFNTLFLVRNRENLFHAAQLLMPTDSLIGIDNADIFEVWGNRRGTVHRVRATVADVKAFVERNALHLKVIDAISVNFWHRKSERPRLSEVDEMATLFRASLNTKIDFIWTLNAASAPDDAEWIDTVLFINSAA